MSVQKVVVVEEKKDEYQRKAETTNKTLAEYRHIYREFLPDPNPQFRNTLREKLERIDMISRRSQVDVPEFYVG